MTDDEGAHPSRADRIMHGTPEEKIKAWLEMPDGSEGTPNPYNSVRLLTTSDWADTLLPHISFHSTAESPHPTATFRFTVQLQHCNRLRNLHGGCAATLFDFLTTMSLCLISRPGFWHLLGVSRTLNVTYLRPVPVGESVLVACEAVQVGKRVCTLRGTMTRESDGEVLALCEHGKVSIDPPPPVKSKM